MGYYSRKRNIRKFWKNPLVNLCYTLSVLAFVAGLFGICAFIGGVNTLPVSILLLASGVLLILLGNKLNLLLKSNQSDPESPFDLYRREQQD